MTEARLGAAFLEAAYTGTAVDARLSGAFLEAAYTGTAVDRRLAGVFLEVATGKPTFDAAITFTAGVTAAAAVVAHPGATVPVSGTVTAAASAALAAAVTVAGTGAVAASAANAMSANATVSFAHGLTAGATAGAVHFAAATVAPSASVTAASAAAVLAGADVTSAVSATASVARATGMDAAVALSGAVAAATAATRAATSTVTVSGVVSASASIPLARISAVELDADIAAVTVAGVVPPPPPTPEGTAGLQASITNPALAISPGSLIVRVTNGVPGHSVTLSVDGNSLPDTTVVLDDSGAAAGVNVPIAVTSTGSHTLTVTDDALGVRLTGPLRLGPALSLPFTVSSLATPGSYVVPSYPPPAAVQNTTGVRKWVFQDPASSDVYHFTYNPNQMTSPFGTKNIQWTATTAIDGQKLAYEGQQAPVQWQFQGFIRSQAEYDAFVHWQNKRNRIWITDHYGRAWLGYITQFDPVPHRSHNIPWSHDYTIHVLLFDGPVTPA